MIAIGIDPGKDGAIVALDATRVAYQARTRDLLVGGEYDATRLAQAVRDLAAPATPATTTTTTTPG